MNERQLYADAHPKVAVPLSTNGRVRKLKVTFRPKGRVATEQPKSKQMRLDYALELSVSDLMGLRRSQPSPTARMS
jgi:hypothetical protein